MKKILLFVPIILFLASCSSTSPKKAKEQGESKVLLQRFLSKSRFLDNGFSVRIFLSIDIDRTFTLAEASKDFVISYNLYPDYSAKQTSSRYIISNEPISWVALVLITIFNTFFF